MALAFLAASHLSVRSLIMKPGSRDHRHRLLISGDELRELKRHTGAMAEAFGLDRKIANYKGTRPLTLYRWDLECLMEVIDLALRHEPDYPDRSAPAYLDLQRLGDRLHQEYDAVYGHEKALAAGKEKVAGKPRKKAAPDRSARGAGCNQMYAAGGPSQPTPVSV